MKHFNLEDWIHFIHRLAPVSTTAEMRKHLESCPRCRQKMEWWRAVTDASANHPGSREALEPQEAEAHSTMGQHTAGATSSVVPELVWDSLHQPAPAGVRSLSTSPRQFLYRAGDYLVDMLIGTQPNRDGHVLVGQVLCSGRPGQDLSKIPVIVEWEKKSLGTVTNTHGEFQIDYEEGDQARVRVQLQDEEIVIPLGAHEDSNGKN